MAKWANAALLDGGSDLLRTRAGTTNRIKELILKAYSAGDSYATVNGTNKCGEVSLVAGDIVQSGGAGVARVTTFGAKAIPVTADSGASPNLHVAIVDTVNSEVLLVTDETSDQVLTNGNTFNCPNWTWTVGQPT